MARKKKEPGKRPAHWEGKTRKWRGNDDECPVCGVKYKNFHTDYKFADIHEMLWVGTPDYSQWKYKRRNTILGLWHQIKMSMWDQHLRDCERYQMYLEAQEKLPDEFTELVGIVLDTVDPEDFSDIPF